MLTLLSLLSLLNDAPAAEAGGRTAAVEGGQVIVLSASGAELLRVDSEGAQRPLLNLDGSRVAWVADGVILSYHLDSQAATPPRVAAGVAWARPAPAGTAALVRGSGGFAVLDLAADGPAAPLVSEGHCDWVETGQVLCAFTEHTGDDPLVGHTVAAAFSATGEALWRSELPDARWVRNAHSSAMFERQGAVAWFHQSGGVVGAHVPSGEIWSVSPGREGPAGALTAVSPSEQGVLAGWGDGSTSLITWTGEEQQLHPPRHDSSVVGLERRGETLWLAHSPAISYEGAQVSHHAQPEWVADGRWLVGEEGEISWPALPWEGRLLWADARVAVVDTRQPEHRLESGPEIDAGAERWRAQLLASEGPSPGAGLASGVIAVKVGRSLRARARPIEVHACGAVQVATVEIQNTGEAALAELHLRQEGAVEGLWVRSTRRVNLQAGERAPLDLQLAAAWPGGEAAVTLAVMAGEQRLGTVTVPVKRLGPAFSLASLEAQSGGARVTLRNDGPHVYGMRVCLPVRDEGGRWGLGEPPITPSALRGCDIVDLPPGETAVTVAAPGGIDDLIVLLQPDGVAYLIRREP